MSEYVHNTSPLACCAGSTMGRTAAPHGTAVTMERHTVDFDSHQAAFTSNQALHVDGVSVSDGGSGRIKQPE
jgi:hypothetical protein